MPSTFCANVTWVTPSIEVYDSLSFRLRDVIGCPKPKAPRFAIHVLQHDVGGRRVGCCGQESVVSSHERGAPRQRVCVDEPPAEFAVEIAQPGGARPDSLLPGSTSVLGSNCPPGVIPLLATAWPAAETKIHRQTRTEDRNGPGQLPHRHRSTITARLGPRSPDDKQ